MKKNTEKKDKDLEEQVGYPDISKANTKMVVIASLVCILLIFLLSVLVPAS